MSILGNFLSGGSSYSAGVTRLDRFALWIGRRLALRHRNVAIARSARISPEARVNPRRDRIEIGENSIIAPGAMIQGNVRIGDDSSVQAYTVIVGYGEEGIVRIGSGVRIASHTMIVAANHVFDDPDVPIHKQGVRPAAITIEDDVWIGGQVFLTAGVTIGRGSVIGAGSVVTRSIPPRSIAVGSPARVIRTR